MDKLQKDKLKKLSALISEHQKLNFTIANIGCRPIGGAPEPFEAILEYFSGSKIIGFETDKELCEKLNKESSDSYKFFYQALGEKNEKRKYYNTTDPMCSSLYKPNDTLLEKYQNLEMAKLKDISEIHVVSLDNFCLENQIKKIDLIKIDIQGAELDVFKGGENILEDTLFIVSEAEFFPIYINQPLFGDIHNFLIKKGFMFNKFLDFGGRSIKPIIIKNNINAGDTQCMWTDALFVKDLESVKKLDDQKILKLAVFSFLYGNPDMTFFFLSEYDLRKKTDLKFKYLSSVELINYK
jgi:FkbM family methyltransferase